MQLASITFDGEKKNSKHYIIPASYFKSKGITPIPVVIPKKTEAKENKETQVGNKKEQPKEAELAYSNAPLPKIELKKDNRTSGLSLKSIKAKKEHLIKQMEVVIDVDDLPKEVVTEEAFSKAWLTYIEGLHKKGEKIMASILEMDTPKLVDTNIEITFPNDTLRVELERAQYPLMEYLRKTLKNYDLKLDISVNEEVAKKYAYTTLEKYEKLKEKNPNIELLRKTFGLDIN
jgi:DNA polymerase-3 subunit gamma/tau